MSDSERANAVLQNETGYRKDLRDAELQIVAAGTDLAALAIAFHRHSEAVRNMMIAEMIPSFQKALKPLLEDSQAPVVQGIGGLQNTIVILNNEFHTLSEVVNQLVSDMSESKADRVSLRNELNELKIAFIALERAFVAYQAGNKRNELDTIKAQIATLQRTLDNNAE